ncbi:uncharacterized protein LOC117639928 [Thrips palmi]|uniref:Uncharacterized protein LOC117639928 n=1 Tax=Thrips palmi TaxID=161013 RepID=A0A6P8ZHI1_THRPL|nr:uncharacterized protein LOC117639928 [Thrips palmi]
MKLFLLLAAALAAIVAVQAVPHVEDYNGRSNNDQSLTAVSGPLAGVGCSIRVLGRGAALVAEYTVKCFVTSVPSGPLFFLFFPFCVASSVLDIISITSEDLQKCATSLLF